MLRDPWHDHKPKGVEGFSLLGFRSLGFRGLRCRAGSSGRTVDWAWGARFSV